MAASLSRKSFLRFIAGVSAVLLVAACSSDPAGPSIADTQFAASLEVDLEKSVRTASGMYYRDIVVGTGTQAGVGSTVTVRYTLYHTNGQQREAGTLDPFKLGAGAMIAGFDEGIRGMRVGGRRQLIIPPDLAYKDGMILVFTVELLSVS